MSDHPFAPSPRSLLLFAFLGGWLAAFAAAAAPPATVSPGAIDRASPAASACATFSWAAVAGAGGYEIVVLDLARPDDPQVVVRQRIAGGASSWTPDREGCLAASGQYGWTIRALDAAGRPIDGNDAWAELRRFRVPALPSAEEVEAALETLRRWRSDDTAPRLESAAQEASPGRAATATETVTVSGVAAVRGEMPGTTGETIGVFGISSSLSGAGLVALNTSVGADLILDGSFNGQVDTLLTQAGIDRPSPVAQTFQIQNSGVGAMTLEVEGTPVSLLGHLHAGAEIASGTVADARIASSLARDSEVLSLVLAGDGPGSTLDADTLDGRQGSALQGRVTGTCAAGQAIAAIAEDGTVTCAVTGGTAVLVVVDDPPGGDTSEYSSIALGADGLPLVAYFDATPHALKVAHCTNAICSSRQVNTVDDAANSFQLCVSLAVAPDGFPVIAYYDATLTALKVAKCNDHACAGGDETRTVVDNSASVGMGCSLAIGNDGLPIIAYHDDTAGALKVAKCNDPACSGGDETLSTVDDPADDVGASTSLAIGNDGLPVIAHRDRTAEALLFVKCNDAACAPGGETYRTIEDSANNVGSYLSLVVGADGFPVIAYLDASAGDIRVAKCADATCASPTISVAYDFAAASTSFHGLSLTVGNDGLPLFALQPGVNRRLVAVKCNDPACAGGDESVNVVDEPANLVGYHPAVTIGADGNPVVSYGDITAGALKLAKCNNPSCRN